MSVGGFLQETDSFVTFVFSVDCFFVRNQIRNITLKQRTFATMKRTCLESLFHLLSFFAIRTSRIGRHSLLFFLSHDDLFNQSPSRHSVCRNTEPRPILPHRNRGFPFDQLRPQLFD